MIRQMQFQFVAVAMTILVGVFLLMLGSINLIMQTVSQSQSLRLLAQIAESDRYASPEPPEDRSRDRVLESAVLTADGFPDSVGVIQCAEIVWGGREDWDGRREEGGEWERPQPPTDMEPPQWETWEGHFPPDDPGRPQEPSYPADPETQLPQESQSETDVPETSSEPADAPVQPETAVFPETEIPTAAETAAHTEGETAAQIRENTESQIPPPPMEDHPDKWNLTITLDHFAILAGHDGEFIGIRNTEDYTDEQAQEIMEGILQMGETSGMYGWLQYCMAEKDYGTLIVITDKSSDQGLLNNLFRTTVIVGILMLLVLFVFLCIASRWITKPVRIAFARQKQFVSDAGHELKTPLTILSANADILQDEIGENKWLGYMQEQTGRMNQLVGDLLRLARMDNAAQEYVFSDFNLSTAITATVLPFESQAFELHKHLELDIQPGVDYWGSEQHIRQLTAIFIDNALKYSDENGIIKVTLLRRGENRILEFYNTGCDISPEESRKIFERFYRGDKARGNQGKNGYGLGLAIARSIMEAHRIRIQVTCEQGSWIRFLLTL